jgi:hypothetical protein
MSQKMWSCICGNTELEKVPVNLLRTNDADSLELVALLCRGDGCGRVTFRPNESRTTDVRSTEVLASAMTKTSQDSTNYDHEAMKQLIALFEQMYTERLVYKAIAERDPGCNALVDALRADAGIREKISRTFTPVYECVELNQGIMKLLESLPLTGSKPANGASTALAASK